MDSIRLKYFVSAAQTLNFSRVAEEFFVSQPAVTYQITLLEKELETDLFYRNGKQLSLTEAGLRFLPKAIDILNRTEDAVTDLKRFNQGMSGVVSIVAANTCSHILRKCIREFSPANSNIILDIRIALGSEQIEYLEHGDYDIFIGAERTVLPYKKTLDYVIADYDHLCLALPLGIRTPTDLSDLSGLNDVPFISLTSSSSQMISNDTLQVMKQLNYAPKVINRYNRAEALIYSVDAGVGAAIIPCSLAQTFSFSNVKFILLDPKLSATACVAAWKKFQLPHAAERFAETIRKLYAESQRSLFSNE